MRSTSVRAVHDEMRLGTAAPAGKGSRWCPNPGGRGPWPPKHLTFAGNIQLPSGRVNVHHVNRPVALGLSLALGLLTACGEEPAPDHNSEATLPSPQAATSHDLDPCALLTPADIERVSGFSPEPPARVSAAMCRFSQMPGPGSSVVVSLYQDSGSTLCSTEMEGMQDAEPIDGLGSPALFVPDTGLMSVDAAGYDLLITVAGYPFDASASRTQAIELARTAISRM